MTLPGGDQDAVPFPLSRRDGGEGSSRTACDVDDDDDEEDDDDDGHDDNIGQCIGQLSPCVARNAFSTSY